MLVWCFLLLVLISGGGPGISYAAEKPVARPEAAEPNTWEVVARELSSAQEAVDSAQSVYLSPQQKRDAVELFVKLVAIPSPSKSEGGVRDFLRGYLQRLGAVEIDASGGVTNAPLNLVMEFPASPRVKERPALAINAHLDTISAARGYSPENMRFDVDAREFHHTRSGSFGADDKAGITVVCAALSQAKEEYWLAGREHRRVLVILTAEEESGLRGAKHLAERCPSLFARTALTLTSDGPINFDQPPIYPEHAFVAVVEKAAAKREPYAQALALIQEFCARTGRSFGTTERGLGAGDFAAFPPEAFAGLHLRSPYQNNHRNERVKVDDLIRHIDLFTHILIRFDGEPVPDGN